MHGRQIARGFQSVVDYLREQYGWRLNHELGRGGFGVVFQETVDGVERAVKISLDPLAGEAMSRAGFDTASGANTNRGVASDAVQRELDSLKLLITIGNHPHLLTLIRYELCSATWLPFGNWLRAARCWIG